MPIGNILIHHRSRLLDMLLRRKTLFYHALRRSDLTVSSKTLKFCERNLLRYMALYSRWKTCSIVELNFD